MNAWDVVEYVGYGLAGIGVCVLAVIIANWFRHMSYRDASWYRWTQLFFAVPYVVVLAVLPTESWWQWGLVRFVLFEMAGLLALLTIFLGVPGGLILLCRRRFRVIGGQVLGLAMAGLLLLFFLPLGHP